MTMGKKEDPAIRFHRSYLKDQDTGCWLWKKSKNPRGYGEIRVFGRTVRAHRLSYELHIGPIPRGSLICHRCDVRHCVNPQHLFLGTAADNTHDMLRKGRFVKPNVKLTKEQVNQIKKEALTETQDTVAKRHGINQSQVSRIVTGKIWP